MKPALKEQRKNTKRHYLLISKGIEGYQRRKLYNKTVHRRSFWLIKCEFIIVSLCNDIFSVLDVVDNKTLTLKLCEDMTTLVDAPENVG